jgi:predicted nucleotidyltransferase
MAEKGDTMSNQTQQENGENVLRAAVKLAEASWGDRFVAAYALGSLAHGGFTVHVSDVDLGLVLSDPLAEEDTGVVDRLSTTVKAGGAPLANRPQSFGALWPRFPARQPAVDFHHWTGLI